MIQTLLGPIAPGELGLTYVHEHILTRPPGWRIEEDPDYLLDDSEASLEELDRFRRAGGRTLSSTRPRAGAEIERYTSYSTRSTWAFLAEASSRCIDLFPFMAKLRILRQWTGLCDMTPDYSPLMGVTPVERFYLNAGWGTWGFKATPIAGVTMAELVATGRVPDLIRPFALDRFERDRAVSERASAGTH